MVYCTSKLCQIQPIDPYNLGCLGSGSFKTAKIGRGRWVIMIYDNIVCLKKMGGQIGPKIYRHSY